MRSQEERIKEYNAHRERTIHKINRFQWVTRLIHTLGFVAQCMFVYGAWGSEWVFVPAFLAVMTIWMLVRDELVHREGMKKFPEAL